MEVILISLFNFGRFVLKYLIGYISIDFFFFRAAPRQMKFPRLEVESELQPPDTPHSQGTARVKPCLQPTPQLTTTPDP